MKVTKWVVIAGGALALLAVLIGAFGAHALKPVLDAKAMGWIDTGVFYQVMHALALIACGFLPTTKSSTRAAVLFILGGCLFCGSLYLMALTGMTKLGMITPLGGMSFIFGWVFFCHAVWVIED